jgi:hypothetical protein
MVCKLIEEEESAGGEVTSLMDYLESCLRHKSEMVIYEAAHAIVNLRRTGPRELAPAISVAAFLLLTEAGLTLCCCSDPIKCMNRLILA